MSDQLSQIELAERLDLTTRQIRNLEEAGLPTRVKGDRKTYAWPKALHWYVEYRESLVEKRVKPLDFEAARARKMAADAQLSEIEVEKAQGALLPAATVDQVVGELGDRLRAVIVNVPGNYGLRLEALGVPAKAAEEALTAIAEEMTRALRGVADELEEEADRGDGGAANPAS